MVDNGSWTDAVETSSPITVTGLSNYTNHRISLRAVNAVGASRMSAALKVRPRFTGPVLDTATANGFASITANFSSVLFGGVNGFRYSVEVKEVGTTSLFGFCRVGVSVRSCSVIGLNPDTEYNVTVTHFFRFPSSEDRRKTLPSNAVTVRTNPNP